MSGPDLHAAVDAAIQRHLASRTTRAAPLPGVDASRAPRSQARVDPARTHPSHARFALTDGAATGGSCLIEPSVACVQCGYCQSHGH